VSVLNAGVPGYSTDQSYAYFFGAGLDLEPDLVIVGIHCSDVSDNYESPLYDVANGRLVPLGARATRVYRLGTLLRSTPRALQQSRIFALVLAALAAHHPKSPRPDVADLAAWSRDKIRLEIADMIARGRSHGMGVTAVLMPCKKDRGEYGDLTEQLARAGAPVLDAARAIETDYPDIDAFFFRHDPHLTAAGNRALAGAIAAFLEDRGLLSHQAARPRVSRGRHDRQPQARSLCGGAVLPRREGRAVRARADDRDRVRARSSQERRRDVGRHRGSDRDAAEHTGR
jgi:hypothetical protein